MTEFEQLIDKLGNMSGGHLPPRGAEIARIAWNAAIDTAMIKVKEYHGDADFWGDGEACIEKIQKLRSE